MTDIARLPNGTGIYLQPLLSTMVPIIMLMTIFSGASTSRTCALFRCSGAQYLAED